MFFCNQQGKIVFQAFLGPDKEVSRELLSTDIYKHMGSLVDAGGSLMPDFMARMGSMREAYKKVLELMDNGI